MKKLLVIGLLFTSVASAEYSTYNPYSLQPQPMPNNGSSNQVTNGAVTLPPGSNPAPIYVEPRKSVPAAVDPTVPKSWDPNWTYDRK